MGVVKIFRRRLGNSRHPDLSVRPLGEETQLDHFGVRVGGVVLEWQTRPTFQSSTITQRINMSEALYKYASRRGRGGWDVRIKHPHVSAHHLQQTRKLVSHQSRIRSVDRASPEHRRKREESQVSTHRHVSPGGGRELELESSSLRLTSSASSHRAPRT